MKGQARHVVGQRFFAINRLADHVEETTQDLLTDGNLNRSARIDNASTSRETVRRIHRNAAHQTLTEMLLNL